MKRRTWKRLLRFAFLRYPHFLDGIYTIELFQAKGKGPKAKPDEEDILSSFAERAMVAAGLFKINPVTKTGQRLYMMHMLLLPFLPILALIIQNSTALHDVLEYQKEVTRYE